MRELPGRWLLDVLSLLNPATIGLVMGERREDDASVVIVVLCLECVVSPGVEGSISLEGAGEAALSRSRSSRRIGGGRFLVLNALGGGWEATTTFTPTLSGVAESPGGFLPLTGTACAVPVPATSRLAVCWA